MKLRVNHLDKRDSASAALMGQLEDALLRKRMRLRPSGRRWRIAFELAEEWTATVIRADENERETVMSEFVTAALARLEL